MTPGQVTRWSLTLYISGASPQSTAAVEAVRRVCDEDLAGQVDLTVVNAVDHPELVKRDRILALPTLVRHVPAPRRHLVGNLTDGDGARLREGLDLVAPPRPASPASRPVSQPLSGSPSSSRAGEAR